MTRFIASVLVVVILLGIIAFFTWIALGNDTPWYVDVPFIVAMPVLGVLLTRMERWVRKEIPKTPRKNP